MRLRLNVGSRPFRCKFGRFGGLFKDGPGGVVSLTATAAHAASSQGEQNMTQKANMHRGKRETHGPNERANLTRREFIKGIGIGGGALVLLGRFGIHATAWADSGNPVLKMVLVDYGKCTGQAYL